MNLFAHLLLSTQAATPAAFLAPPPAPTAAATADRGAAAAEGRHDGDRGGHRCHGPRRHNLDDGEGPRIAICMTSIR